MIKHFSPWNCGLKTPRRSSIANGLNNNPDLLARHVGAVADIDDVPEAAYNDEDVWRTTVKETRTMNPVACGELLRYGATVTTWSDDPIRDLREALHMLDGAKEQAWAAWCRVDLASYLEEGSEREQLLERALQIFTIENDRAGISSVLSARGEENPFEVDATGLSEEEQSALFNEGYTLIGVTGTYGKSKAELEAEKLSNLPDPTNIPSLIITTGILGCGVCAAGFIEWGEAPIDGLFLASCAGCLFSLSIVVVGISLLWKAKRAAVVLG